MISFKRRFLLLFGVSLFVVVAFFLTENLIRSSGKPQPVVVPTVTPSIFPSPTLMSAQNGSGIYGVAEISPTCAGAQTEGKVCSRSYSGEITVWNLNKTLKVTSFTPQKNGEFRVILMPGTYVLTGPNNPLPYLEKKVQVKEGALTNVDLFLDSGLR